MSEYDEHVDYHFLEAMGVKYVLHQPWQIGLFPEEFTGKFCWYPKKGTLMVEYGEYKNRKVGEFSDTEGMYNAMMEIVNNQLNK